MLEHKRPLYAFFLVAVICGIVVGTTMRSQAILGLDTPLAGPSSVADGTPHPSVPAEAGRVGDRATGSRATGADAPGGPSATSGTASDQQQAPQQTGQQSGQQSQQSGQTPTADAQPGTDLQSPDVPGTDFVPPSSSGPPPGDEDGHSGDRGPHGFHLSTEPGSQPDADGAEDCDGPENGDGPDGADGPENGDGTDGPDGPDGPEVGDGTEVGDAQIDGLCPDGADGPQGDPADGPEADGPEDPEVAGSGPEIGQ